jgi:hypothetical protein
LRPAITPPLVAVRMHAMASSSNLDHVITALGLIRAAQRVTDAALRLPTDDRAAVVEQIAEVRESVGDVAASLVAAVPGAQPLAGAGHSLGEGFAARPELRALGGMVSFFAGQGSQALGAVAGAAASIGTERDPSLALSERIAERLAAVGVASRTDLARDLDVDPRSDEFRDALERTLGTGHAEWYGSGTYGLPRARLEAMIGQAREVTDEQAPDSAPAADPQGASAQDLGSAVAELRSSVDTLWAAVAQRSGAQTPP